MNIDTCSQDVVQTKLIDADGTGQFSEFFPAHIESYKSTSK